MHFRKGFLFAKNSCSVFVLETASCYTIAITSDSTPKKEAMI